MGKGVQVDTVQRIQDQFLQTNLQGTQSEQSRVETYHNMISRIDNMLADEDSSLAGMQSDFFNSIQDLNTNPTSVGARQSMLNSASNLAGRFNGMQSQFDALQRETNNRISTTINDINTIAKNIDTLNNRIVTASATASGAQPNDLLDQRDHQLTELSKRISISSITQSNGAVTVMIGNGSSLVSSIGAAKLSEIKDPAQPEKTQVVLASDSGDKLISDQLTGGSLGGLLDFRREALDQSMNQLGRIAVIMADQFNKQHQQGLTIEGDPGGNFFSVPLVESAGHSSNSGTATVNVTFADTKQLTTSDYELRHNGVDFTLTRLSDNTSITGTGPFNMDGLDINVAGAANAGDSFLIRPTRKASREFSLELKSSNDIALSSPIRSDAAVSNLGTGEITVPTVSDPSDPNLKNKIEIRFNTPSSTYDVVDTDSGTTLGAAIAYQKGDPINFQGWSVEISGEPEPGDLFNIELNSNGVGNNRNGQQLADIQNAALIGGTANLLDGYGAFISQVGSNTRQAQINSKSMDALLTEAQESRDSVSGVNLDEEAINLTRQQQSYQAAAQIIAAAQSMFQTLLGAVGG
jgi:flagellar hook-associated protein 1 FlgK